MAILKPGADPVVGRNVTGFRLQSIPQRAGTDYTTILQIERGARSLPEDRYAHLCVDRHETKTKRYNNLRLFGNSRVFTG